MTSVRPNRSPHRSAACERAHTDNPLPDRLAHSGPRLSPSVSRSPPLANPIRLLLFLKRTSAVLLLLEAGEGHLGAGDVLLRVLQVGEEGLLVPDNAALLVRGGVRVAGDGAALAAKEAVQVRARLVAAVLEKTRSSKKK